MGKICVLGSMNMDLVMSVARFPEEGETMLAENFKKVPGGKGANQAIAARRLGADVHMIGKIGKDEHGRILLKTLQEDKVNTDFVYVHKDAATGFASINVNHQGQSSIVVVSGANMAVDEEQVMHARSTMEESDVILSQFETPVETTTLAFSIAKAAGARTVLNPAPAGLIPLKLLSVTDVLVANKGEASSISGVKITDAQAARASADFFLDRGVKFVVITLGEDGAFLASKEGDSIMRTQKVRVVDTTAAGDGFIGALAVKLSELTNFNEFSLKDMKECVEFGNRVGALVVQKEGAITSLPFAHEIL